MMPTGRGRSKSLLLFAAVVAAVAVAVIVFWESTGTLVVTVAGPGGKPVDALQVLVDGKKECESSPCRIESLKAGTHLLKVSAAGYQPRADQAVKIQSGDEEVVNVTLDRASDGTGIRVSAEGSGLKLFVDSKEIGPLPQELKDMTPGEHKIRIVGERYETYEESVNVKADEMLTVEPKLKVVKGLITIKEGDEAEGARVLLVTGKDRRPIPKLPIKVELEADKQYTIIAQKKGYLDFNEKVSFEDGMSEKTYVIDLTPETTQEEERSPAPAPRAPRSQLALRAPKAPPAAKDPPKPAASGDGMLNLNSVPVSNVILNGRPLGPTPKIGIKVPAGTYTVMFVHAEHGRKATTVSVKAGETKTAAVRFP